MDGSLVQEWSDAQEPEHNAELHDNHLMAVAVAGGEDSMPAGGLKPSKLDEMLFEGHMSSMKN